MKKCSSWILIIAGVLRMGDFITDMLYIATEPFYSQLYYILCILFLLLPTIPTLLLVTSIELVANESKSRQGKQQSLFALGMSFGEQFGIFSIILGCCSMWKSFSSDRSSLVYMTRYTAILHSVFESMPSAVIQLLNSGKMMRTSKLLIVSCSFSGLSCIFTILRIVYLFDVIGKEERARELPDVFKYTGRELQKSTNVTIDITQETK
jgi:hypothetical protein